MFHKTCITGLLLLKPLILIFFFISDLVLDTASKYVSLAEKKFEYSRARNPVDKCDRGYVTFLNEVPSLWGQHGVDILPPSPEPDVIHYLDLPVKKPVLGKVLYGTQEAMKQLMTENKFDEKDTGIILCPEKMVTSEKYGYTYKKVVSYEKSFSLGHGAFGKAGVIVDKSSQASIVKKKIKRSAFRPEEVLVPLYLTHPCLMEIHGCILQEGKFVEVFMNFAGFSFNKVVADENMRKLLTEQNIMDIGRQGYGALDYLRRMRVMHLDIKPQNLCLSWNVGRAFYDLKICDFGACMRTADPIHSKGWTPAYMAPEQCRYVLDKKGYKGRWSEGELEISSQADLYSFGSSLLYLCFRLHCIPKFFPSHNDVEIIIGVASNPTVLQKFVLNSWDPKFKEVLLKSFCAHPRGRLYPAQAIQILSGHDPFSCPVTVPMTDRIVRKRKASSMSVEDMEVDSPPPPKKIPTHVEEMEEDVDTPDVIIIDDPESLENLSVGSSPAGNLPDLDTLFN
ncbi:myosin light chain kinase, smooth muscle-like [Liolophura sinensis]|uniref:myosin light chain kinase, smooth muscle-like n=1 Tax=Liolophura sinensis TaxID=3198878 RepID=UPI0031589975